MNNYGYRIISSSGGYELWESNNGFVVKFLVINKFIRIFKFFNNYQEAKEYFNKVI